MAYIPKQGDVMWCTLDPAPGVEQAKRRPVIVLSSHAYNKKVGLAIICPITNQPKGYPFEVQLHDGSGVSGAILADHVRSLDWRARNATFICSTPAEIFLNVRALLNALLQ